MSFAYPSARAGNDAGLARRCCRADLLLVFAIVEHRDRASQGRFTLAQGQLPATFRMMERAAALRPGTT
jgi:hypothetical protein